MRRTLLTLGALIFAATAAENARAVNLLQNGDFEILATDEEGPTLDVYGHEEPTNWFRSIYNPVDINPPAADLITPANMNNAAGNNQGDDSDGSGTNSAALNYTVDPGNPPIGMPADWRSWSFATTPGESLIFSMDFKFIGVSPDDFMDSGLFNGLFAQIRSFEAETEGHSTAGAFRGERNVPTRFRQHFAPDVWHNVTDKVVIPDGGLFTDVRISENTFGTGWLFNGQVLIDNIKVIRLSADFDNDFDVDAADLGIWKTGFGVDATGDADGDGDSDGNDFLAWQQELGLVVPADFLPPPPPPMGVGAVGAIPEPAGMLLAGMALTGCLIARRRRKRLS